MAAYASLVSVVHIIQTIQNHPHPPIYFNNEQVQTLTKIIALLQEYLETHSIDDDGLESRIADAAYAAEDVIESYVVDKIEASKTISYTNFYDGLHKVIKDLDLILSDMRSSAKKTRIKNGDDVQPLHSTSSLRRSHSSTGQDTVGLDNAIVDVMNKLTWNQSNRQIIRIVGMGGIGKTTLAKNIYVSPFIVQYYHLRGWATISQEYNSKGILLEVLLCLEKGVSRESLNKLSEDKLGEKLYKSLYDRRYLIVLDDIWNIEAWDKVKTFFPNNNNGSAIMVTTRLSNLDFKLSGSFCYEMSFLDKDKSWYLLHKSTFGEESCPRELEHIGMKIVENCKGLPLSIVVVGGLLANSKRTREHWLYINENLNSILNLQDDERCLRILHLSYRELPVHLKPCFLYMGVYPEDYVIDVPDLMRLWVAEGFLKPIDGKCLEVVAKEYFNDLVDRNLILVNERGYSGETIKCKIHDLLMDVCVREAQKHKFLCVARHHNFSFPKDIQIQRRIVVHDGTRPEVIHAIVFQGTLVRSITCKYSDSFPELFNSRLLRVWNGVDIGGIAGHGCNYLKNTHGTVNCRYISSLFIPSTNPDPSSLIFYLWNLFRPSTKPTLSSPIFSLWNLQTLYVHNWGAEVATSEIWKMSQLRHAHFDTLHLLDPPLSGHMANEGDYFVLGNLQTLRTVRNFKFREDLVIRMSNIKELRVFYEGIVDWSGYYLYNLVQLNIESLSLAFRFLKQGISRELQENLSFPHSIKELSLRGTRLDWGDLGTKIGSLPHLQVLMLGEEAFVGAEWETVEGQFRSLKYLGISYHRDLIYWRIESCTHFPCIERLFLKDLKKLEEIPSEIGEGLISIEMLYCSESAVFSAYEILKEQEKLGNEGLQVKVFLEGKKQDVESLAAPNFQVLIR